MRLPALEDARGSYNPHQLHDTEDTNQLQPGAPAWRRAICADVQGGGTGSPIGTALLPAADFDDFRRMPASDAPTPAPATAGTPRPQ